jgi:hypothetical protein
VTNGDETLVPPTPYHCPPLESLQYIVMPEATAETSATIFFPQPVSFCQAGLLMYCAQPLPPLGHATSSQPREEPDLLRTVPPTPTTPAPDAG